MNYIYNAYHHFLTITKHKCEVMKNCFAVGLYRQGLLHDLSKYSWEEFATGVKYYQGNRSPNAAEKEEKAQVRQAAVTFRSIYNFKSISICKTKMICVDLPK